MAPTALVMAAPALVMAAPAPRPIHGAGAITQSGAGSIGIAFGDPVNRVNLLYSIS